MERGQGYGRFALVVTVVSVLSTAGALRVGNYIRNVWI